jgi:hypothetical protein
LFSDLRVPAPSLLPHPDLSPADPAKVPENPEATRTNPETTRTNPEAIRTNRKKIEFWEMIKDFCCVFLLKRKKDK